MKKLLLAFTLFFVSGCEDDKEKEIFGTYKLAKDYMAWSCDGLEDIVYMTVEKGADASEIIGRVYDYRKDDCNGGSRDCYRNYYQTFSSHGGTAKKIDDSDEYRTAEYTYESFGFKLNGDGNLEHTMYYRDETSTKIYERVSDDIKTYGPFCSQ